MKQQWTKRARLIGMIAAALTVTMVSVAVAQLPPGGTFQDDNGNTHEGNIEAIAAAGITKGCNPPTNDLFCPGDPLTRGQMAAFLVRALDLPATSGDFFIDDESSIFESDINRVAGAGVARGCNPPANDRFCPDNFVTRGQMAAFLVRGFGYTFDGGGDLFSDDNNSVFEGDIDRLAVANVTLGCNPPANDRFCPGEPVARDQMGSFLARASGLAPIVPPPPVATTTTTTTLAPATTTTTTTKPPANCHSSYPDFCIPPPPPDLNCADIPAHQKPFTVRQPDPHRFDADKDGVGCESG